MSFRLLDEPGHQDRMAMTAAWRAAVVGLGAVSPNPAVGAVVVVGGEIVATGSHRRAGLEHAEVNALHQAGTKALGSTVYVTLEPCHHVGRQPACTEALIQAGVQQVVYGMDDPDQRCSGLGAQALIQAGVEVRKGVFFDACRALNPGYLHRQRCGRPRVVLKTATTLEGAVATASGESQWITGPHARRFVHTLRARMASVMVGAGTARSDAVQLNVRLDKDHPWWYQGSFSPHRLVVSRSGNCPAPRGAGGPTWLVGGAGLTEGFDEHVPANENWHETLSSLADRGINEVLCEGGAGLATSLLEAGVVDEWIQMIAPMSLRGSGYSVVGGPGVEHLNDAQRGTLAQVLQLGQDALLWTVFDEGPSFADQTDWLQRLEPK